jgi:chaperonin GroES
MTVKPLFDRVVVKPDPIEEQTSSGIILMVNSKEVPNRGTVVSVGSGVHNIPMSVKPDDKVLYGKGSGTSIKVESEELLLLKEYEIFAIIDNE